MKIFKRYLILVASIVAAYAMYWLVYWAIYPSNSPPWSGFGPYDELRNGPRAKTLWDWFDLLIVPAFLALSVWLLSTIHKNVEARSQLSQQRQEALENYFDRLSELLLKNRLRRSSATSEVRTLARNWSLAAFRTLDGVRKGESLQFLYESNLINKNPIIVLNGADLRNCYLRNAVLSGSEIRGAYFNDSTLCGANLKNGDFRGCDFRNTDLRSALLDGADLSFTFLNRANLSRLDLSAANLKGADLARAKIWRTVITPDQREVIVLTKMQQLLLSIFALFVNPKTKSSTSYKGK